MYSYKYNGVAYKGCITEGKERLWCPTKVDEFGVMIPGQWGYCRESCPLDPSGKGYNNC